MAEQSETTHENDTVRQAGAAEQDGRPRGALGSVLRRLAAAEAAVGAFLIITILTLMLVQTAQRYLPTGGWVWTGELARFSLVWMTFAMSGYLMARDEHVTLKLIDYAAKGTVRRVVATFANVMVAIVCLNLAYEAFALVTQPTSQVSSALRMPITYYYVIPLAGLVLTTVRSVVAVFVPQRAAGEEQSV